MMPSSEREPPLEKCLLRIIPIQRQKATATRRTKAVNAAEARVTGLTSREQ